MTNNLIVVFGAGGQRDHEKRPRMGAIAAQYADIVILTSDNPRTEDPQLIIDDIKAGITPDQRAQVLCELDREQAIKKAYALSKSGSVIALLGKGQEEYQIIGTTIMPYSDKKVVHSLY
jgi:UDP-N-acetylmuramoyl-L-alanyl-D-glutamate--2,6-diaminopimelate ligase